MLQSKSIILFVSCILCSFYSVGQTAILKGRVSDNDHVPIADATISIDKSDKFVLTDTLGFYEIEVPAGKKVVLRASGVDFDSEPFNVTLKEGETRTRNIFLESRGTMLGAVQVKAERERGQVGTIGVNTKNVQALPGLEGVEGLLKMLVGHRNELTSQYTVRGGNFDENLVYVNDFEINRPFLVRSGQQEGLSFVNPDMVDRVDFSVGGFQARYGDKMSSVLDVTYQRPEKFAGSVMASLLGFQAHLAGGSRNKKLSFMVGYRQKTNQYLLQSQPTKGQYNPSFTDIQALINYRFSSKFEMEFIGNYALNSFRFQPERARAAFGSVTQAMAFTSVYTGGEIDQFDNTFGGLSFTYSPNKKLKLKLLGSLYNSYEKETFDIKSEYILSVVELDLGSQSLGKELYSLGAGGIHRYARNFLNANVANVGLKGTYSAGNHFFSFGGNVQHVNIDDRLLEWERRDSAGFSIPYDPFQVNMYQYFKASNQISYNKADAYIQDNILLSKNFDAVLTLGVRGVYNFLNKEMVISPRANFSFKPKWQENMLIKLAAGQYAQPPFYREMRAMDGTLNTDLKAQKSWQFAAGLDYNFIALNDRPFKFTAELFYKSLSDLVPYDYDNVRIRYAANNNGIGYAYGGELRLFGDLVKDAESWVSIGYLKTMERLLNPATGEYGNWQPRPTDGRVTFGVFFSDYLPQNHNFRVYLNMMYATGLPSPLPERNFKRRDNFRLPAYRRVDIGFSALLLDASNNNAGYYSFFKGLKSVWVSLEVFNLLGIANTLSYEYIESLNNNYSFYIPNRLTSRMINFKIAAKF